MGHDDTLRCAERPDPKQYRGDKLLSRQLESILFAEDLVVADRSPMGQVVLAQSGRNQIP